MVETIPDEDDQQQEASEDDQSMFIPEQSSVTDRKASIGFGSNLNPAANAFTPSSSFGNTTMTKTDQQSAFRQIIGANGLPLPQNSMFGMSTPSTTSIRSSTFQSGGGQSAFQTSATTQQPGTFPGFGLNGGAAQSSFAGFGQNGNAQQSPTSAFSTGFLSNSKPSLPIFGQSNLLTEPTKSNQTSLPEFGTPQTTQQPPPFSNLFGQNVPKSQEQDQRSTEMPRPSSILDQAQPEPQEERKALTKEPPSKSIEGSLSVYKVTNLLSLAKPTSPFSGFSFTTPVSNTSEPMPQQPLAQPPSAMFSQQPVQEQSHPVFNLSPAVQSKPTIQDHANDSANASSTNPSQSVPAENSKPSPIFSFIQPASTSKSIPSTAQSKARQDLSLPNFEPSTTPQGTPKKNAFEFPSVSGLKNSSEKSSLPKPEAVSEMSSSKPFSALTPRPPASKNVSTSFQPVFQSPFQPLSKPEQPKFTAADREKLVENTSRLILTQPQGLIEYFVSHHVSNLLQTLVKQYLKDQQDEAMGMFYQSSYVFD